MALLELQDQRALEPLDPQEQRVPLEDLLGPQVLLDQQVPRVDQLEVQDPQDLRDLLEIQGQLVLVQPEVLAQQDPQVDRSVPLEPLVLQVGQSEVQGVLVQQDLPEQQEQLEPE